MISRIRGVLADRGIDRVEVVTPGGVGYEVSVPRGVLERLPGEGEETELLTFQVVREDALLLFGFLDPVERELFGRLLSASRVGPRLALSLLSALPAYRLVRAVRERDVSALTAVSGVGRKTAERLVLELAEKLDDLPVSGDGVGGAIQAPAAEEAVRALTVLGFPEPDAARAVREAVKEEGEMASQALVRAALARLR